MALGTKLMFETFMGCLKMVLNSASRELYFMRHGWSVSRCWVLLRRYIHSYVLFLLGYGSLA